jgi:hypothetical protein
MSTERRSRSTRSSTRRRNEEQTQHDNDTSSSQRSSPSIEDFVEIQASTPTSENMTQRDPEISKLGSENYPRWKIEAEDVMRATELWDIVFGTESCPADATRAAKWRTKDSRAKIILRRSLSDVYFNHTRDCNTSKEILDRIMELKEPNSIDSKMQAWQDFHNYTWKETDDVTTFWSGLQLITARIQYNQGEIPDTLIMAKVLVSLPKRLANFKLTWDLCATSDKEAKSLIDLKNGLINAERNANIQESQPLEESMAFRTSKFTRKYVSRKPSNRPFLCFRCQKPGHSRGMSSRSRKGFKEQVSKER